MHKRKRITPAEYEAARDARRAYWNAPWPEVRMLRKAHINLLLAHGWAKVQVAEFFGVSPSRIDHFLAMKPLRRR